ncbi:hypothetical protein [Schinkia azotoformans]|uniref:hypothetical protein n=1 Tax=Schinkia azotoformans TaxID=1454 RepID=UPI002DC0045A|nr:hypothetical protein [Schinkia azotoformans]MEC1771935.1 hypothetical protein [Schinkia azotoformans]MED4366433.1 hypothetical protein [Schinkia azotoformans]
MNKETYQAMIRGLRATIIEKEVVFGEAEAKNDVLELLDLLEDLDQFWNSEEDLNSNASALHAFIEATRKRYSEVRRDG